MGLFDFLFSSGVSNSQKKAHRNAGNNTTSDHENYARGYEDGYDDCCLKIKNRIGQKWTNGITSS